MEPTRSSAAPAAGVAAAESKGPKSADLPLQQRVGSSSDESLLEEDESEEERPRHDVGSVATKGVEEPLLAQPVVAPEPAPPIVAKSRPVTPIPTVCPRGKIVVKQFSFNKDAAALTDPSGGPGAKFAATKFASIMLPQAFHHRPTSGFS